MCWLEGNKLSDKSIKYVDGLIQNEKQWCKSGMQDNCDSCDVEVRLHVEVVTGADGATVKPPPHFVCNVPWHMQVAQ